MGFAVNFGFDLDRLLEGANAKGVHDGIERTVLAGEFEETVADQMTSRKQAERAHGRCSLKSI